MEANKILQADVLDILFDGRNKQYGAYELRKKYNKRIAKALLITVIIACAIVFATILSKAFASKNNDDVNVRDVVVQNIDENKTPPPPPPPPKAPPPPQLATTQFTPPVIEKDKDVKKDEIPPVNDMQKIDVKTVDGRNNDDITLPSVDNNKGIVQQIKPVEDPDAIFVKVEIEASVNIATWRRHLESQLQRYIEDAANAGMAPGQYTVQVHFLVEKDGSITDVQALNDPGYGLGKEAVDVVKKGPKWSPGEQNGKKVRSYHTQPITFLISEQ